MGWYGSGNLVLEGFHSLASRVSHQNSIFKPSSRILQTRYLNSGSKGAIFNRFSSFSSISKRLSGTKGFEINKDFRRFYYVDRKNVQHFRQRGLKSWFQNQNPRHVFNVVIVGSVVVLSLYFGSMQTVPYSNRTHLILMPKAMEKWFGETVFELMKKEDFKEKLLPSTDPKSIRVRKIGNNIIDALNRGMSNENVLRDENEGKVKHRGWQPYASHLDGLNWEFLVVDGPINAFCCPGGKIVVFTGMLDLCRSDAELATIIGHEVGHAVARHTAERMTRNLGLQLIIYQYPLCMPWIVNKLWSLFFTLPFSRRNEIEADYIGLVLLASAGYDPRIAPKVFRKLEWKTGSFLRVTDYFSTHPSGGTRADLLAQAPVMEEALNIYKKVTGVDEQGLYNFFSETIPIFLFVSVAFYVFRFHFQPN